MKNKLLISIAVAMLLMLLSWFYLYNRVQIIESYDGRRHLIIQTEKIGSGEAYRYFTCPVKPFQMEFCHLGMTVKSGKLF